MERTVAEKRLEELESEVVRLRASIAVEKDKVALVVAEHFGYPSTTEVFKGTSPLNIMARQMVIYLLVKERGLGVTEIDRRYGCTNAARAFRRAEHYYQTEKIFASNIDLLKAKLSVYK